MSYAGPKLFAVAPLAAARGEGTGDLAEALAAFHRAVHGDEPCTPGACICVCGCPRALACTAEGFLCSLCTYRNLREEWEDGIPDHADPAEFRRAVLRAGRCS